MAIILPAVIKSSHIFTHHTHEVCNEDSSSKTHYHQTDLDCDFYKFKLTKTQIYFTVDNGTDFNPSLSKEVSNYYKSFIAYQRLSNFLRGPPRLV